MTLTEPGRIAAFDGLRGFAVLAVMLFHGFPTLLPGGFLGVDIFLVLSGYLITGGLLAEWKRSGGIDMRRFMTRRALRLGPPLALLLAASLAVAIARGEPLAGQLIDMVLVAGGLANWTLAFGWDRPGLLAHTWSLALEWQFYALWPLLLGWLLARSSGAGRLLLQIGAAILVCALWRAWLAGHDAEPLRLFNGLDTRAGTLLAGAALACLALLPDALRSRWIDRGARLAPVALIAVAGAMTVTDWTQPALYHGGFDLMTIAAVLLVAGCIARPGSRFRALLEWRPLQQLGRISYGVYLWHFPVLWLLAGNPEAASTGAILSALGLSVAIAAASFHWLERPLTTRRPRLVTA